MGKVFVPPIKSQGIKTKLVEWISSNVKGFTSKYSRIISCHSCHIFTFSRKKYFGLGKSSYIFLIF